MRTAPRPSPAFAALLLALLASAITACTHKETPTERDTYTHRIHVAAVVVTDVAIPVTTDGVLAQRTQSALSFKIGGIIREINVRAGDHVKSGDVLATLDQSEIAAEVARARAAVDKTQRDLDRAKRLHEEKVATLEQVQDAQTAVTMATAALQTAEFNQRFATITAPDDGVILKREADVDELVSPGKSILLFAPTSSPWMVRVGLSERELTGVHPGSTAMVEIEGRAAIKAHVTHVAGITDPATRTITTEVELIDGPADVRSGFVATVTIQPDSVAPRAVVPSEALVTGDHDRAQIYLLNADGRSVHREEVTVGTLYDGRAYLASPLAAGTPIVTAGAEFLTDDSVVAVVP